MILSEKLRKDGVPFIKYADSELPVTGKFLLESISFSGAINDCVSRGLLYQGRLWDAYDGCPIDVHIMRAKNG